MFFNPIGFSCFQGILSPRSCPVTEQLILFAQKYHCACIYDFSQILKDFFQIQHFAPDEKKGLFQIQIKDSSIFFLFRQKLYLQKTILPTDRHLIEYFFLDHGKLKRDVLIEHFPQYESISPLFLPLWKCISKVNFQLAQNCLIEEKEAFLY